MNSLWSEKSFEDCIESVEYTPKINRSKFLTNGLYPIISQEAEFINGYWNDDKDLFHIDTPVIIFGDHTKILKFVDFDFVLGADGVKILKPRSFLDAKYFFYFLKSCSILDLGYARHYRILKQLRIQFPPLPEQRRIVAILDDAFARLGTMRDFAQKKINAIDELEQSFLHQAFSNELS